MQLNKTRQKLYLDGKVGLINDGTVEQLREVTGIPHYDGTSKTYREGAYGVQYHPISWFYEEDMPKWVKVVKADKDGVWYENEIGNAFKVTSLENGKYFVEFSENTEYLKHFIHVSDCTPCDAPNEVNNELPKVERTPSAYKLNIDIPEWKLKVGDVSTSKGLAGYDFPNGNYILESMLKHIATPIYATPYTLSNGQVIILSDEDIENIKKLINEQRN